RELIDWWGPVINEYYGGTETGGAVFHTSAEALRKPGTVGRPIDGAAVKILDAAGKELEPGEIGEGYLRIGGFPAFMYHGMDDKRPEVERARLITVRAIGYVDAGASLFPSVDARRRGK